MGKGQAIAPIVALALVIGLLGGCGASTAKSTNTNAAAQAAAARANIAAARRRLAAAQARVARQRRALAAALHRRQLERTTTTTTTTVPKVAAPTSSSTQAPVVSATSTVASDTAAVQRTIDVVNAAFAKGVVMGIAASETANYYIHAGVYSGSQCSNFEAARGLGQVSDRLVLHPGSVVPTPGWVDPVLGAAPTGRIYSLAMDDVETQVPTHQQRTTLVDTHAAVVPDGQALLFLRCS